MNTSIRKFWMAAMVLLVTCAWTVLAFAQDEAPPAAGSKNWWVPILSLVSGFLVSYVVNLLKGIPFVSNYPKVTAAVLAIILSVVGNVTGLLPEGIAPIITAILTQLSTAVATHEIITKPVRDEGPEPNPLVR